jgi:NAD(P)-dependent dehydrogenase (short-subunit alcohol dehydrogenase family)
MNKLEGKTAVVTGGSSGIGLATAQRFVSEGAHVYITGRRQSELDKAVKQIGKNVTGVQGDVSNLADLDRLYDTVKEQKGRIDILFANAGIMELFPLDTVSETYFDKTFSVNVKGIFFTVQKSLPLFNDGGTIVLTGSVAGSKGTEGLNVYGATKAATKAAVRSLARSFTAELKNRKIRVNVVSPGRIDTPAASVAISGLQASQEPVKVGVVDSIPLGRMGTPDEIASAVLFLASDDSSFVTGIELFVDGGRAQV